MMDNRENILLIRLKSMGDVLFTLPAVHAVREHYPAARLHFLVSRENASLLQGFSDVDEIIALDRSVYGSKDLPGICRATFELLRRLRRPRFSLAIDFQGFGETELLSYWSGAPQRWGCVYHPPRGWLYTRGFRRDFNVHPAQGNLDLLCEAGLRIGAGQNDFALPAEAEAEARKFFATNELDFSRPTLFIQPFTSALHKNWPLERYLAVAQYWRQRGAQVLFGGGPTERAALEAARQAGFPVSAGVPLLVTGGLAKLSSVVLGGDTGVLHLAVALGRQVVMIMDPAGATRTCPYQHPEWALTPAQGRSVSGLEIEVVQQACERAFAHSGRWPMKPAA